MQDSHGLGGGDLIRLTREIEIAVGHSATTESSVGGLIKQFNRGVLTRVGKHHSQIGLIAMTWIVPIGLFSLPLTLLMNLYQRSKFPSSGSVQHPSSLLLRLGLGRKAVRSTDKSTNIGASRAAWDAPGRGNCSSSL